MKSPQHFLSFLMAFTMVTSVSIVATPIYAQAPNLGAASNFAVFTGVGAFTNDGTTLITGDIGTNVGGVTGFPPGIVNGNIHVENSESAAAATATQNAYAELATRTCGQVIGTTLGNGQILTPDVYCLGAASTINGVLTLDAEGDPDAIFIFLIDGALSTSTFASVELINGAAFCNIWWRINGAFSLGESAVFQGSALVEGAISLLEASSVYGRTLATSGAIDLHNTTVQIAAQDPAPTIVANGPVEFCEGDSVVLSGNNGGVWNTGEMTPSITVFTGGEYFVVVGPCVGDTSNVIEITVFPNLECTITQSLCEGETTELCATAGAATYAWSTGETTRCINVTMAGEYSVTITSDDGCVSTCSATVANEPMPNCTITGERAICNGGSTELCVPAGAESYLWSTGATSNCITVSEAGTYSVTITSPDGCTSTCSATVTEEPVSTCTITGDFEICEGESTLLCVPGGAAAYLWSTGATSNCITVSEGGTYSVTVTDANGCISMCSEEVVFIPFPPDAITCPADVTIECSESTLPANTGTATAVDYCGITPTISYEDEEMVGACPQERTITRTWTATYRDDLSSSCVQTIVVVDTTPPVIMCPVDVTLECDQDMEPLTTGFATATDNCTDPVTNIVHQDNIIPGNCPNAYTIERTWTATDECGNESQCTQLITVEDTTPPVITCPADATLECGQDTEPLATGFATATDNCTDPVTDIVHEDIISPGSCPNNYTIERIWTATDACGNESQCTQTITVADTTPPVITCPADVTLDCDQDTDPLATGSATATDNCTDPVTNIVHQDNISPGNCPNNYTIERIWTATDECGNESQCTQTITVEDTTPPAITIVDPRLSPIGDTTFIQCYGQDPEWVLPEFDESSVVATDNCSPDVTVEYSGELIDEGNCEEDGYILLYRLTWTATDACGNSSSASVMLALVDRIAPVIFGVPEDITVNCDEIPAFPDLVYATDECLCACVVMNEESIIQPGCQDGQVLIRTWTATDDCGNTSSAAQRITLIDNASPQFEMLQPELKGLPDSSIIEYTCNSGQYPNLFYRLSAQSVSTTESCGDAAIVNFSLTKSVDPKNCEIAGYKEELVAQWTAVDACGNETSLTLFARLIDNEAPVFVGVPEMTCIGDPALLDIYADDNCGKLYFHFWDMRTPNPCGNGDATLRTYEAYDDCGNRSTETVILIPNDNNPPLMEFVNPLLIGMKTGDVIELVCDNQNGGYTPFDEEDIVAVGSCSENVVTTFTEKIIESRDCTTGKIIAILELQWTSTDICGNIGVLTLKAHVIDNSGPEFTNFRSTVTIGCFDTLPGYTITDNCGDVTVTTNDSIAAGACELEYVIYRVITATDFCGNVTMRSQTINVGDGKGPIIEGVEKVICDDLTIPNVTAYDDCAGAFVPVTMEQDTLDVNCQSGLVIVRKWSATDLCGNTTVVRQTIYMDDNTPPEIQIPWHSVIKYFEEPGMQFVYFSELEMLYLLSLLDRNSVVVVDECGLKIIPKFTLEVFSGDCIKDGFSERRVYTWVATDICGNTTTFSFTVHIIDDIPPTVGFIPRDILVACVDLPPVPNIRVDERAGETIVYYQTIVPGNNPGEYIVTRTWIVKDACGNEREIVQIITWIPDNTMVCELLVPEKVDCNTHGVVIGSDVTGGNGPYTYRWELQGEKCFIQSGQGTPEIIIYVGWSQVKIILTVTDAFGCVSMCMYLLDCDFGIWQANAPALNSNAVHPLNDQGIEFSQDGDKTMNLTELNYWPNPTDGNVNLSFESAEDHEVQVAFTNLLGQLVKHEQVNAHRGFNLHKTNIDFLEPGSYLMQVTTAKEKHTKVIVVVRQ